MTDSPTAPPAPAPEPPPTPEIPATLAEAIVRALADLPNIVRDREANIPGKDGKPGYSYKYVDLATTIEKVKPVLARWGLALLQDVAGDGKTITVTTTLIHVSGETRTTPELGMAAGATPQATGSAITYARRYQAMAVLGLAPDDDDGQAAAAAPYIERLPIEQRSDVTVSRASAEAYVALCEKRGLTMDHIKAIVQRVTGGRTDQPALVLEAEVDALTAATKDVVERRRQTDQERAARTGTPPRKPLRPPSARGDRTNPRPQRPERRPRPPRSRPRPPRLPIPPRNRHRALQRPKRTSRRSGPKGWPRSRRSERRPEQRMTLFHVKKPHRMRASGLARSSAIPTTRSRRARRSSLRRNDRT
jgi:hypothetical protein